MLQVQPRSPLNYYLPLSVPPQSTTMEQRFPFEPVYNCGKGQQVTSVSLTPHHLITSCHSDAESLANLSIPHLRQALLLLESEMANLRTKREEIESRLEQAVRTQCPSPIHRLPCELLASIFALGVFPSEEEEDPLMLPTLMFVSRYWHDIAINTPTLWSKIRIGNHNSVEKAARMLARSKSVPLDIFIDFNDRYNRQGSISDILVRAMNLLAPSIRRWKSFHLSVPNRFQANTALSYCTLQAPILRVFTVHVFHSMQEDLVSNPPNTLFCGFTPVLEACSLKSFHLDWDHSILKNLQVIKFDGYWNGSDPSTATILQILRACPDVRELALRNLSDVSESRTTNSSADLIHLPHLTKISLYYSGSNRTLSVLDRISFPALERIDIGYLEDTGLFFDILHRQSLSALPLRHLRVESAYFSEAKLVRLLQRLPNLRTLDLVDVEDLSSDVLKVRLFTQCFIASETDGCYPQVLSRPINGQPWVCPKIQNLSLEGCAINRDQLRTFVESRLPDHARAFPTQPPLKETTKADDRRSASQGSPERLRSLDLTRCHVSKAMLQWLKIYVAEVRCDASRNPWGDSSQ